MMKDITAYSLVVLGLVGLSLPVHAVDTATRQTLSAYKTQFDDTVANFSGEIAERETEIQELQNELKTLKNAITSCSKGQKLYSPNKKKCVTPPSGDNQALLDEIKLLKQQHAWELAQKNATISSLKSQIVSLSNTNDSLINKSSNCVVRDSD